MNDSLRLIDPKRRKTLKGYLSPSSAGEEEESDSLQL
jgi:hypothetical protein